MADTWKQWEGTTVDGKFRLERYLGGSEHSVVFLTEAGSPAGKATIKFVPALPQALDFQRSAWEQASRLSHPHLIRLFGSGQCRLGNMDLVYAVMEYAEENVAQILPARALTADETRDVLKPVLAALKYLHQKGLAHGSLKPTNVLAVQDQLKLSIDQVRTFGKPGLAQDSSIYAAPEVAREGARAPSDAWSLGAIVAEVLTQRPPVRSSSGQIVVPPNLPEPFGDIASHCLVESPQDRWTLVRVEQRLAGIASQAEGNRATSPAPVQQADRPSAGNLRASEVEVGEAPAELGSGRRYMVAGISFLLILVAIYAGSQMFRRGAQENTSAASTSSAAAPNAAREAENPSPSSPAPASPTPESSAPTSPPAQPPANNAASSAGQVLERTQPNVSASARATITGKVRVRVNLAVDESGKVSDARFITPGPSQYFASRAMEAARRWTFTPPQVNGQPSASKWVVSFTFTRKGVDASAEQSQP
jgi:TonB family protein